MVPTVIVIFVLVYLGMLLGKLPGLALDRTGVALLGAIFVVAAGAVPVDQAWSAVDMPTLYLLFALMILSAQFRLAGFYGAVVRRLVALRVGPRALLALVIAVSGGLSSLLTNDVVCLAVTPVLAQGCLERRLNPLPFLLALACASNVGSAATLLGSPQNILIGQSLELSFGGYLLDAGPAALAGLVALWALIAWQYRTRWHSDLPVPKIEAPPFDPWQTTKALGALGVLLALMVFAPELPRHGVALTCAAVLLLSRKMASRPMLALVDWQLLLLFIGLFVVNHAFAEIGAMQACLDGLSRAGIDPQAPAWLFTLSVVSSNLVSNVPATMLLLPAATHAYAGPILALSSTLAGNLIVVGSIANIIVINAAKPLGIEIDFKTHAKTGVPVTLVTLAIAILWLLWWTS